MKSSVQISVKSAQSAGKIGLGLFFSLFPHLAAVRAGTLTIATYNVENYVATDRMTAEGYRLAYPKPEMEKQALRAVIRGLDADILVLEEMGPAPYLAELRRDLKAEGFDYPAAVLLDGPDADRHVALLSRRPPKDVKQHADLEFTYLGGREKVKRGLLEATFATEAGEFTLFAVHLKSRFTDRADDPQSAVRRAGARRGLVLRPRRLAARRFILPPVLTGGA